MSGFRAQANHRLYLARILIAAWRRAIADEEIPVHTLAQAFEIAVCEHLVSAYGWFLLEITRPDPAPDVPPRGCSELPPPPAGRVYPGEISEFLQLESAGWLAELLRDRRVAMERRQRPGNLATESVPGPGQCEHWADNLQVLFDRMSDSLDEY